MLANGGWDLTLILLTWTVWRAPTNASKWRMGFNSAFKGLIQRPTGCPLSNVISLVLTLSDVQRKRNISILKCTLYFKPCKWRQFVSKGGDQTPKERNPHLRSSGKSPTHRISLMFMLLFTLCS